MPPKIKKILVRNVGVLKAFDTPNAPQLADLTIIYARNGRGKTTLSSILRAASTGNSSILKGRRSLGVENAAPNVTLITDAGNITYANGAWSQSTAPIEVFDASFIADNFHAGEAVDLEHDRSLFTVILGHDGVRLSKQQEFFNGAAKRAATAFKDAEAALKDDVPEGLNREEFFAYAPTPALDAQIVQAEKDLKGIQQADRLTRLQKFQSLLLSVIVDPTLVLARTVSSIDPKAREQLASHFAKFRLGKQGEGWVRFGQEHVHDDTCPFCGKEGVDENGLLTLYGQIFGEAYQAHLDAIKAMQDEIALVIGPHKQAELSRLIASNAEALRGWAEFYDISSVTVPNASDGVEDITAAHAEVAKLFETKRQSPLVAVSAGEVFATAERLLEQSRTKLSAYNQALAEVERLIQSKKSGSATTEAQAKVKVEGFQRRKRRNDKGVQRRIDTYFRTKRADARAKKMRTLVQGRLKSASELAASHYYEKVNDYLEIFGASFRISKISNSMTGNIGSVDYGLIVRGHSVDRGRRGANDEEPTFKNTLSTGDKTTLAFAFFLSSLDKRTDLSEKIIVFDDPLSSHDTHRQGKTVELLVSLGGKAAQIIVLSHDAHFLRRVSKQCGGEQACYEIALTGDNWSKATEADLDQLCQNEDARQLKQLRAYYERREGNPSDVAPAVRKVLETYYRRTYRAYFDRGDNLGPIIKKIREHGSSHPCADDLAALESCNASTSNEHHGDDPELVSRAPIDPDELHGIVGTCLRLVHVVERPTSLRALG